jgi:hypothetical protein
MRRYDRAADLVGIVGTWGGLALLGWLLLRVLGMSVN